MPKEVFWKVVGSKAKRILFALQSKVFSQKIVDVKKLGSVVPPGGIVFRRRSSDIISMLVNIYGSKELFVNEYRSLLSNRLLSAFSYETGLGHTVPMDQGFT